MIRFRRLTPDLLDAWLVDQRLATVHERYRLRVWREVRAGLAAIKTELIAYIDEAFEDARRRIRRGFEDDLSPFNDPTADPAANYPVLLHHITLQGYLGETLVVLLSNTGALTTIRIGLSRRFCFAHTIKSYSIPRRSTSAFFAGKHTTKIALLSAGSAAPAMTA